MPIDPFAGRRPPPRFDPGCSRDGDSRLSGDEVTDPVSPEKQKRSDTPDCDF
jgi:hypothetical protein